MDPRERQLIGYLPAAPGRGASWRVEPGAGTALFLTPVSIDDAVEEELRIAAGDAPCAIHPHRSAEDCARGHREHAQCLVMAEGLELPDAAFTSVAAWRAHRPTEQRSRARQRALQRHRRAITTRRRAGLPTLRDAERTLTAHERRHGTAFSPSQLVDRVAVAIATRPRARGAGRPARHASRRRPARSGSGDDGPPGPPPPAYRRPFRRRAAS